MRKFLFLLMSVLLVATATPKKADAAVGAVVLPHTLIGIPFIVAGAFISISSLTSLHNHHHYADREHAWLWFWVGIFLLDGENGTDMVFTEIKSNEANQLGLTEAEFKSYNEELPEINAIREHIVGDLAARATQGQTVDRKMAQNLWQSYGTQLSPNAFSALKKVSGQTPKAQ